MYPYKCQLCGRFMSTEGLRTANAVNVWPSDPYEPPENGFVHKACDEKEAASLSDVGEVHP